MTLIISDRCLSLKLLIFKLICQCVTPIVDQVRSIDCQARNARFVEILPDEVINEVLARLETLLT